MKHFIYHFKPKTSKKIIPFVTTFNPATPNLKKILIKHWDLIAGNHNLAQIFQNLPKVAYRKDKSLRDYLVRQEFLHFNLTTKELYTVYIVPTHMTRENLIRCQLLTDFNQFARRMRPQYVYRGKKNLTSSLPRQIKLGTTNPFFRGLRNLSRKET